ncbi:MAG TPA: hypothetical protein VGW10_19360, partial [Solirubrobacteraceae bacterium]|nr:hypothetical protein [Solirubrobacteraceae bacterium]
MSRFTSMRLVCAAVVLGVLGFAPAAQAAWSPPERVGEPSRLLTSPALAFTPDGRGLLTASLDPGVFGYTRRTPGPSTRLATLAPGGGNAAVLGTARELVTIALHGDQTIALRERWVRNDRDFNPIVRLGVSIGTVEAPLGTFVPLERYRGGEAQLAANARGDAVAMWTTLDRGRYLTRVAVRRAGRPFRRPRTIAFYREDAGTGARGEALAIGPDGRMLVAVTHDKRRAPGRTVRRVRVAELRADGRLGPGRVVGRHLG